MGIQLLEACLVQGLLKFVNYDPLTIGYDFDMKKKKGVFPMGYTDESSNDDLKEDLYEKNKTLTIHVVGFCNAGNLCGACIGKPASFYGCAR